MWLRGSIWEYGQCFIVGPSTLFLAILKHLCKTSNWTKYNFRVRLCIYTYTVCTVVESYWWCLNWATWFIDCAGVIILGTVCCIRYTYSRVYIRPLVLYRQQQSHISGISGLETSKRRKFKISNCNDFFLLQRTMSRVLYFHIVFIYPATRD